jgi:2-keto-3-deoxy-L-rhamnonate aldolase RhmA
MDWLWLDMEHGLQDLTSVERIAQVVGYKTPCMVRIPINEEMWFKRVLDLGVSGLVVPQVNTAQAAARAVSWSKFPPQGTRSVGISRAHGYGLKFDEYLRTANDETALVIQVEHIEAVNNLKEILKVEGLDGIFIGPYDLSASMKKPGQINDPEVVKAIDYALKTIKASGLPAGTIASTAEGTRKKFAEGYSFVVTGMDITLLSGAAVNLVKATKQ